ncbi:MAG: hypothetical protein J6Y07_03265 [Alphaproteobacteria bacterium]|nr:hypothetical protein [Alphaproteobacteria bacterium]
MEKKHTKDIMGKIGWGLVAIACIAKYISGGTDQDYINAPSRQNVKNPSPDATFAEDIKSTKTVDWFSMATMVSGGVLLLLSKKQSK